MEEAEIGMGMWEELKAILDCLGEEVGEDNRERKKCLYYKQLAVLAADQVPQSANHVTASESIQHTEQIFMF